MAVGSSDVFYSMGTSRWLLASCTAVLWAHPGAQGPPMLESAAPPGLRAWLGKDLCGSARWVSFHAGLADVVGHFNARSFSQALDTLIQLLTPVVIDPYVAFDCATAVGAAFFLAAQCCDQLETPLLAARLRQEAAIFASFDYQMKGEEYIDQSPWPIRWLEGMDGILRSMALMKQQERTVAPWWGASLRVAVDERLPAQLRGAVPRQRVAIVSVCDYDPAVTPLARLSQINKESYAQKFGYSAIIHEKSPVFEDPLSVLLSEPISHRPPAWSKIDAILQVLAAGQHDWVFWMDCDSFFMDGETRLEEAIALAEGDCAATGDNSDLVQLQGLVRRWMAGPPEEAAFGSLLDWYDNLLEEHRAAEHAAGLRLDSCARCGSKHACVDRQPPVSPPRNRTLGWDSWLFQEQRKHLIASEDGLMLNTGNVLVRASSWSWQFFQKVRWMTFGRSPVTQHPWWEQTAMVYLLQLPFSMVQARAPADPVQDGYAPACFLLSQKHLNSYPPLVASALKTHEALATHYHHHRR